MKDLMEKCVCVYVCMSVGLGNTCNLTVGQWNWGRSCLPYVRSLYSVFVLMVGTYSGNKSG